VITIYQIKDVEKILAEDGYEIVISETKFIPLIFKKNHRKMGVPFIMHDFLMKNNSVGEAAQYLKNIYDND